MFHEYLEGFVAAIPRNKLSTIMGKVESPDEVMAFFNLWEQSSAGIGELAMSTLLFHRKVGVLPSWNQHLTH
jgi:hypothetical protein